MQSKNQQVSDLSALQAAELVTSQASGLALLSPLLSISASNLPPVSKSKMRPDETWPSQGDEVSDL
jgi:hypothetical protein